jgi:hypothetical protein
MQLRWALVGMLAALMVTHLSALMWGVNACIKNGLEPPEAAAPACTKISNDFQRTAETYIAVILALMATPPDQS